MKSTLYITIQSREAVVQYGKKKVKAGLDKKSLISVIEKVVRDIRGVQDIIFRMEGMTFSGTRQVIVTVNTIAWALGIKVNGKKQLSAKYSAEPNITMPKS